MRKSKQHIKQKNLHAVRAHTIIVSQLRFGNGASREIYFLKNDNSPTQLFNLSKQIFKDTKLYEKTYGPAFPKTLGEMFSKNVIFRPAARFNEIVWSIARCLRYGKELGKFASLRETYEIAVIKDDRQACISVLEKIKENFGCSIWLLEAKLCAAYNWGGLSELNTEADLIEQEEAALPILAYMVKFIRARIESTQELEQQKESLEKMFSETHFRELYNYFEARVFGLSGTSANKISALLFFEGHASIPDLYEVLILSLQTVASIGMLPDEISSSLAHSTAQLFKLTRDPRILPLLRAFGDYTPTKGLIKSQRAGSIEAYTIGEYERCANLAQEVLNTSPNDMSIFVLWHKAALKSGETIPDFPGILGKISKSLTPLLAMEQNTYSAAHELLKITERFYPQQWSNYIRSSVFYELRQEGDEFPPLWLRDVFVRDLWVSPFSAVAASKNVQELMLRDPDLISAFPCTVGIYNTIITGIPPSPMGTASERVVKHLAHFHLIYGDARVALDKYTEALNHAQGAEAIRCASGVALAHLKLGNVKDAAEAVLAAYICNKNVPTCLPLKKIVESLSKLGVAFNWPDTIAVPMMLELYYEYIANDKLADLRISFEKFQSDHAITTPETLIDAGVTLPWAIMYLERVWRPEVMKQTILYGNSREIEETRVKVCQFLAQINPANESLYLDEIKDRVKRLEIAKGLKMVEQSKVYVDIPAIKKEIVKKLENPYKSYKANQDSAPEAENVAETIASTLSQALGGKDISKILESFHFLSKKGVTEADVQFEAMYAEVRNEFLFGAHGLNAYLSTRVRHGVLSNTLRKTVEDQKLVTAKNEDGGGYKENDRWQVFGDEPMQTEMQREIDAALAKFSFSFDEVLDELKDNLLQVRVEDRIVKTESSKAMFTYKSSSIERLILKSKDRHGKGLDYFVDRCVDHLWDKTDKILQGVQLKLTGEVRVKFQGIFDELSSKITSLPHSSITRDLINAIALSRTNTLVKLTTVASWFKRSEVYDRQDYSLEFPVEVAHNMIKNTISHAADWSGLKIINIDRAALMPGRTLDAMVYVFYGLIENAIKRSNILIENLNMSIELGLKGKRFSAKVSNNIEPSAVTQDDIEKIRTVREAINSQASHVLAQGEGLSGLHKVWLAANGPFYTEPKIDFGIAGDNFFVNLEFNVERVA